jgi:hypothetical protein
MSTNILFYILHGQSLTELGLVVPASVGGPQRLFNSLRSPYLHANYVLVDVLHEKGLLNNLSRFYLHINNILVDILHGQGLFLS